MHPAMLNMMKKRFIYNALLGSCVLMLQTVASAQEEDFASCIAELKSRARSEQKTNRERGKERMVREVYADGKGRARRRKRRRAP